MVPAPVATPPAQQARVITSNVDNILFSHELFKGYSRKRISPRCVLKVDLRKVYDSTECSFLRRMLIALGFPFKIVQWIMACVTTVSYSLMLNGGLTPPFKGKGGIREGDPIADLESIRILNAAFHRFSVVSGL
ncbi:uncharacterized protein LOC142168927 [Nicotiana tabacum]|uniref:Uncharacterized protein LOC142168927 n=1 Tax=Nicotiana tabacum TaxID=4097 RepID=A0AC58SML4_TOBAC